MINTIKKLLVAGTGLLPAGLIMFSAFSCSRPDSAPDGILSKGQMAAIFAEVYLTEEKLNRINLPPDSAKEVMVFLKDKVLADQKVSDSVFRKSFDYYVSHPVEMELIYTALVDSLQLKEERYRKHP